MNAMNQDSELYHFGIKKMKWGVNRYQTKNGQWTEEGLARRREREGFGEDGEHTKNGKYTKDQIINSGNAKLVSKYRSELSTDELRAAVSRIDTEAKLNNLLATKEKKDKYGAYIFAAKVFGAAAKGFNDLLNWSFSPAGKVIINTLNGKAEMDRYITKKIREGDYNWLKQNFNQLSITQQEAARKAMSTRDKFMARKFDSDRNEREDRSS